MQSTASGVVQATLIGVLSYFIVVGPAPLDVTNIAWIQGHDPPMFYPGWVSYRHSPWMWPITLNPDFQKSVSQDPLWAGVKAVKEKRVYRAPTLPFGWFDSPPGVNRLMAVTWLTGVLYPGLAEIDLRQKTSEFYRLFYGVDLSAGQLDELLADSSAQ